MNDSVTRDTQIDQHLDWKPHVYKITKVCCATLSVLKRLKVYTPFHVWKQLTELLILSRPAYCNNLFDNISTYMKNRLQKVQNATAAFVLNKYAEIKDVLGLKWLTTEERIELSKLIFSFKVLHDH